RCKHARVRPDDDRVRLEPASDRQHQRQPRAVVADRRARVDDLTAQRWQHDAIVEPAAIRAEHEARRVTAGAIEADAELGAEPRAGLAGEHAADALRAELAVA